MCHYLLSQQTGPFYPFVGSSKIDCSGDYLTVTLAVLSNKILNMLTQACLVAPLNYMELVKPTRILMQVFALPDNNVELGFIPSIQSCL